MRLVRRDAGALVFLLRKREHTFLIAVLGRYPAIPPGHRRLSRGITGEQGEESQRLLDEALAEQRSHNQRRVRSFLIEPNRFTELKQHWRLTLTPEEAEWLLQVLNDVRVGCWIQLGSPDFEAGERIELDRETVPVAWAMEAAAGFEYALLSALGSA